MQATPKILDRLAELKLDGRKIRNMVRAIQLNRTRELSWDVVDFLLPYINAANTAGNAPPS